MRPHPKHVMDDFGGHDVRRLPRRHQPPFFQKQHPVGKFQRQVKIMQDGDQHDPRPRQRAGKRKKFMLVFMKNKRQNQNLK